MGIIPLPSHILPVLPWTRLLYLNTFSQSIPHAITLPRGHVLLISRDSHCNMLHTDFCSLESPRILAPNFHNVLPTYLGSFPLPSHAAYLNASYNLTQKVHLINSLLTPVRTEIWEPFKAYSRNCLLLPQTVTVISHPTLSSLLKLRRTEKIHW